MSPTEDAVKAASSVDMPVLEGLRLALGSLKDPRRPWDFNDWTQCTCGHIYAGAHRGKMAAEEDTVAALDGPAGRYGKMLRAIIDANDLDVTRARPTFEVSDATEALAKARSHTGIPSPRGLRNAAITLVAKTIKALEGEQREAMRAKAGK